MVSSNKILTVSYGTFSCTAEGFDDPLAVVKDTTHFFRGVVREDRFFGAEPPQFDPDTASEMLQHQIRAEASDQGLAMHRSLPARAAASTGAMTAALTRGPARSAPRGTAPDAAPRHDAAAAPERGTPEPEEMTDSVSAKLQRIRAVVSGAAPVIEATAQPAAAYAEDDDEDATAEDADISALFSETPVETAEVAPPTADRDDDAAPASIFDADDADTAEDAAFEGENLFADTIAALVSEADRTALDDLPERRAPGDIESGETAPEDTASGGLGEDATDDGDALGVVTGSADDAEALEATDAVEALEAVEGPDADATVDLDPTLRAETIQGAEADTTGTGGVAGHPGAERDDASFAETLAVGADADIAFDFDTEDKDIGESDEDGSDHGDDTRLMRVKRADLDAAITAGNIEALDERAGPQLPRAGLDLGADEEVALTPEQEADLARELAEVTAALDAEDDEWDADAEGDSGAEAPLRLENPHLPANAADERDAAETSVAGTGDDAVDGARRAVKLASAGRAMLTETPIEESDRSVSRILDETNTQLDEPEGNRRRSAIAHLRAAVAATRADRLLGRRKDPAEQDADETEPYREDLADAVRPRRPEAPLRRSERPAVDAERPAPLKLVAEQRVDMTDAEGGPVDPVRPRRVARKAAGQPVEQTADTGFVAYAETVGASSLPDLLEAAAAYMSFVEGQEQFSRPQLMNKVKMVDADESTREDWLRSFGKLLRDGKIEKTHGGRFTASDTIAFKPDSRAAG